MKVTGCCIVYSKGLSEYLDIPLLEVVLTCNPNACMCFYTQIARWPKSRGYCSVKIKQSTLNINELEV